MIKQIPNYLTMFRIVSVVAVYLSFYVAARSGTGWRLSFLRWVPLPIFLTAIWRANSMPCRISGACSIPSPTS